LHSIGIDFSNDFFIVALQVEFNFWPERLGFIHLSSINLNDSFVVIRTIWVVTLETMLSIFWLQNFSTPSVLLKENNRKTQALLVEKIS